MESHLVIIQPSAFCNIDCSYCYVPNRHIKDRISDVTLNNIFKKFLSSDLIKRSIGFLWHIGEPMAMGIDFYKNVRDIVERWNIYNFNVSQKILTNGMLITDAWCKTFKDLQMSVSVSVDGPEYLHDLNRRDRRDRGTHKKVMEGVKHLREHGIPFGGLSVLTLESLDYPEEIYNFFLDNGFTHIGFNIEEVSSLHAKNSFDRDSFAKVKQKYRVFLEKIFACWLNSGKAISIREFENNISVIKEKVKHKSYVRNCEDKKGLRVFTIQLDGSISTYSPELASGLDGDLKKFVIGNINDIDTIEDLYLSEAYQRIRKEVRTGIANCRNTCDYFDLCGGGEPCVKLYEGGSFEIAETPNCVLVHQVTVDMLLDKIKSYERSKSLQTV